MSKTYYEVGCGAVMLLGAMGFGIMYWLVSGASLAGDTVEVQVVIDDAVGLERGNEVMVAGVTIGSITDLSIAHDAAAATLSLASDARIRRDAKVRVRSRSVLGEKYLEILPQARDTPALVDGDTLSPTGPQMEIDEMVNALGPLVAAIEPEVLQATMASLSKALAEDPDRLSTMLANLDTTLANTADASQDLSSTLASVRGTMGRANRTLASVDARASEAEALIAKAEQVLEHAESAAEPLPEAVEEARAVLQELRTALDPMSEAAANLETLLDNLKNVDEAMLHRILREDGVRVRLFGSGKKKKKGK